MEDGVDDLGAALELVAPIGVELFLVGKNNLVVRRDAGSRFTANGYGTVEEVVIKFRGQVLHKQNLTEPITLVSGDVEVNGSDIARLIYELIERGAFLSD